RCRCGSASTCTVSESAPASTNASRCSSGFSTMRCTSIGSRVTLRIAAVTAGPTVRLGTKWPSMTSTWIQSAPACSAARTCSPRRVKSAERIEGAIFRGMSDGGASPGKDAYLVVGGDHHVIGQAHEEPVLDDPRAIVELPLERGRIVDAVGEPAVQNVVSPVTHKGHAVRSPTQLGNGPEGP